MRLMITRPRQDAEALAGELVALGIDVIIEPLLSIELAQVAAPDLTGVQALLLTSANGVRAFAASSPERALPLLAVGDASARAATEAGFKTVTSATGDVDALARLVSQMLKPEDGALLHIAGSKVAGDLAGLLAHNGYDYRRLWLYDATKAQALSADGLSAIKDGTVDGVVLYSPRTAESFTELLTLAGAGQYSRRMNAFCLSEAVATKAAKLSWKRMIVADTPDQAALINSLREYG